MKLQIARFSLVMDRVIAYLNPSTQPVQPAVAVNLDPPKIFSSTTPAILVIFMGEPQFKPVETNRTDLLFALNTNWDVLYDTASRQYYLLHGEGWLTAPDVLKGPWSRPSPCHRRSTRCRRARTGRKRANDCPATQPRPPLSSS